MKENQIIPEFWIGAIYQALEVTSRRNIYKEIAEENL